MDDSWSISIDQSIPGPLGAAISGAMRATGEFLARVPAYLRGRQEIGTYRITVAPDVVARMVALVDEIGLWRIFDDFKRAPDQPAVIFTRKENLVQTECVRWPFEHLPPSVEPLISMFNHLVDEARQGPRRVLAGEAQWVKPVITPKEPLELGFRFFNPGSEPIQIQSPRTPEGTSESALVLMLSRIDPRRKTQRIQSERNSPRIELLPESLIQVGRGGPTEPTEIEHLDLAPGEEARFTARQGAYLAPGQYRAVLLFDSCAPEPPGPRGRFVDEAKPWRKKPDAYKRSYVTAGQLAMELPTLTVAE